MFTIAAVLRHAERRDGTDPISHLEARHTGADGLDDTGAFVPDVRGKLRNLQILAGPEHALGPIQTQCLHLDAYLALFRGRYIDVLNPQHFRTTGLSKTNHTRHGIHPRRNSEAHDKPRAAKSSTTY